MFFVIGHVRSFTTTEIPFGKYYSPPLVKTSAGDVWMTGDAYVEVVLDEVADTEGFGRSLAAILRAGDLVILDGPLGVGKTALSRGIGAGLGVIGKVTSPTFVIARAHRSSQSGHPGMVHVDAYRLGFSEPGIYSDADILDELDALDLDTYLQDSIVVVEWGAGLFERLAERHLLIRMSRDPESEVRRARWRWVDA